MGHGITVTIDSKFIRVGSPRFMELQAIPMPAAVTTAIAQSHIEGITLVLVAIDTQVEGAIQIVPRLRPAVKSMLRGLRRHGIKHISIVSGDHKHPMPRSARSLDMDSYFHEALPHQKAMIVEQLQHQGKKVCYVGDGINDAIAMNTANVSVSLSGASTIATDTAQAISMGGNLTHLCELFDIAHRLKNSLWRSLTLVTIPTVVSVAGAILWGLKLGGSYLIIYSTLALAVGNAMLPILAFRRTQAKAISVNKHTVWLVFSPAFCVAAAGTELDYAPAAAPCRRAKILRHSVCLFPAIA